MPAATRADLVLVAGLAPALAAAFAAGSVFVPSLLDVWGLRPDHCSIHDHHTHLCALHGALPPVWIVACGAGAVAMFLTRLVSAMNVLFESRRSLTALERLGHPSAEDRSRVDVPGSPWICVAAGVFRQRIVVSASLRNHLSPACWEAAIAHERAHLARHDPLIGTLLSVALAGAWPGAAGWLGRRWREASEQAADARAARDTSTLAVAEALVAVARLRLPGDLRPALAMDALERRVGVLLEGTSVTAPARPWLVLGACIAGLAALAVSGGDSVHHALESMIATLG
jgi:beta-lactamase regulating signal transducer with metallopeptidase domain